MQYLDLIWYLPNDILTKVDPASMAVGLEVRVPLLDHRVVELSWRLPASLKLARRPRQAGAAPDPRSYVPRNLTARQNRDSPCRSGTWLRGPLRGWAEELLRRGTGATRALSSRPRSRRYGRSISPAARTMSICCGTCGDAEQSAQKPPATTPERARSQPACGMGPRTIRRSISRGRPGRRSGSLAPWIARHRSGCRSTGHDLGPACRDRA